ncbi:MAG TPA: hypothetical protein VJB15_03560, partial [Rhodothermia bacterium]|nr:hypothetical protein [Rhodothermia bacterium]
RARASVIARNETLALVAPPASRFAYEMAILPLDHEPAFAATDLNSLARMLQLAIAAMNRKLARPAYNWVVRNASPRAGRRTQAFHWSIEITPRLAQLGGFELGSGMYINIISPETAAAELRDAISERGARSREHGQ